MTSTSTRTDSAGDFGPRRPFDWEAAGRELGATLDGFGAIVVVGSDPVATGKVAVGIARAQAARRRVAVGDLFAESPPIQELVTSDDPHGLVDSFLYGVSLTRIAHPVADAGDLHVMPSGTEPPSYEEMLPNPRWSRLASGFREVGALLVLAAPVSAPRIEALVGMLDGAVLVGESLPRDVPVAQVISTVREPRAMQRPPLSDAEEPEPEKPTWNRRRIATAAGIALTLLLAAAAAWLAYRPLADGGAHPNQGPKPDTTRGLHGIVTAQPAPSDSAARDTAPAVTVPRVTNPADSAQASAFAVELAAANSQAGAILRLQQIGKNLPGATFSPVQIQDTRWFYVIGGAYPDRASADSLLAALRRRKILDSLSGEVVRAPFAFLIDSGVKAAAVPGMVATYADHAQPVYALRQADGTVWLLAGAFQTVEQSSMYAETLRASNITPVLVYRKGRPF